jgi:hypothetical protein
MRFREETRIEWTCIQAGLLLEYLGSLLQLSVLATKEDTQLQDARQI